MEIQWSLHKEDAYTRAGARYVMRRERVMLQFKCTPGVNKKLVKGLQEERVGDGRTKKGPPL